MWKLHPQPAMASSYGQVTPTAPPEVNCAYGFTISTRLDTALRDELSRKNADAPDAWDAPRVTRSLARRVDPESSARAARGRLPRRRHARVHDHALEVGGCGDRVALLGSHHDDVTRAHRAHLPPHGEVALTAHDRHDDIYVHS